MRTHSADKNVSRQRQHRRNTHQTKYVRLHVRVCECMCGCVCVGGGEGEGSCMIMQMRRSLVIEHIKTTLCNKKVDRNIE